MQDTNKSPNRVEFVSGTTGLGRPAESLPKKTKRNSATIIEMNPTYSMITYIADLKIKASSGIIMPAIIKALDTLQSK